MQSPASRLLATHRELSAQVLQRWSRRASSAAVSRRPAWWQEARVARTPPKWALPQWEVPKRAPAIIRGSPDAVQLEESDKLKRRLDSMLRQHDVEEAAILVLSELQSAETLQTLTQERFYGYVWLFLQYKEPRAAFELALALRDRGFALPRQLSAKLIFEFDMAGIEWDKERLSRVLGWLKATIVEGAVDEGLMHILMEVAKRMVHPQMGHDLLELYTTVLRKDRQFPAGRLWGTLIDTYGARDMVATRSVFDGWRKDWQAHKDRVAREPGPQADLANPVEPYLALLRQLCRSSTVGPDEPYYFVREMVEDGIPLTAGVADALLHLELSRRRFVSFWSFWASAGEQGHQRTAYTWRLAIKARVWDGGFQPAGSKLADRRKTKHGNTLSRLQKIGDYPVVAPPSPRELLNEFLEQHVHMTFNSPSERVSTQRLPIVSTAMMNRWCHMLVAHADWAAAAVLLEMFPDLGVETDKETYRTVFEGAVKWSSRSALDNEGRRVQSMAGDILGMHGIGVAGGRRRQKDVRVEDVVAIMRQSDGSGQPEWEYKVSEARRELMQVNAVGRLSM